MDIGSGRKVARKGTPCGTPDQNPFFNVIEVDGCKLRAEYTVSNKGMYLGLIALNKRRAVRADIVKGPREQRMIRAIGQDST